LKKPKLYFVLPDSLGVKEIKGFKRKFLGIFLGSLVFSFAAILGTNHLLKDVLGLGYNQVETLTRENEILKKQLQSMSAQLQKVESAIGELAQRDNQLRLAVDLPTVDDDTRRVGTGGSSESFDFGLVSSDVNELLRSTTMKLEKLERAVKLQRESYDEVYKKYEVNKVFFSHIPAIKPMEGFYAINSFGTRNHPVLQVQKFHEGLDIINDVGTPVHVTGDGVVTFVGRTVGYGITIEVDHGFGFQSLYAHLSKALVKEGQKVKRGDVIARSGRSGLVSGPHLHYEVRLNGEKQNPINYFFEEPVTTKSLASLADGER